MNDMDIASIEIEMLSSDGHPFQSPPWAYLKQQNGWTAVALHLESRSCNVNENLLILTREIKKTFHIAYIPFCPHRIQTLLLNNGDFQSFSESLCRFLPRSVVMIRYDLPFTYTDERYIVSISGKRIRECEESVQPQATSIIDLKEGYEKVRSLYRKRACRAIRNAVRQDLTIARYQGDTLLFDRWYELYRETAQRDGFSPRTKHYISRLVHDPEIRDRCPFFLAFHNGVLSGGVITICSDNVCVYLLGATKRISGISPGYPLLDRSVREACERGCLYFDFHGVAGPFSKGSHLESLTLFKQSFGGTIFYRQPSTDYIRRPFLYSLYSRAEALRYKILKKRKSKGVGRHIR